MIPTRMAVSWTASMALTALTFDSPSSKGREERDEL
jgi:hypothetical protein